MRNWIIVLLIFIMPLALYAFFDAKAQNEMMCKVEGTSQVQNPKAKIIKFSSPMCSECKEASIEMEKALKDYKDSVLVEEINVVENVGKSVEYNKLAIKKFKVTLVPTTVFVNKSGKVVKRQEGVIKSDEIKEILDGIE
ncbi:MAG: thioredoxin family protein [Candidatus Gastranaerophilales bacterium]|nr:thioredoxin family protein [Candidatus Gastranaerophilales bacterium]